MTSIKMPAEFGYIPKEMRNFLTVSPGLWLWQNNSKWQKELKTRLQPIDLTYNEVILLAILILHMPWRTDKQKWLSRLSGLDKMAVSYAVGSLEAKGLISRQRNIYDGRALTQQVSSQGFLKFKESLMIVQEIDSRIWRDLHQHPINPGFLRIK